MQYKHVPQPRKLRGSNKYEKSTRFVAAASAYQQILTLIKWSDKTVNEKL